jgi:hypothetical protein
VGVSVAVAKRSRLGYRRVVAKTVIVSDDTIRQLIEAHASMAAWYYQMSEALRAAGVAVETPSDAQRKAYVAQMASHFPEIAQVAHELTAPRPYVPPPVIAAPTEVKENEGVKVAPPPKDMITTPAMVKQPEAEQAPAQAGQQAPSSGGTPPSGGDPPPPPPMVDPSKVKYE